MENRVFLFPLQNSTLFKKVTLPFHIFEPRYRKMIHDSLTQEIPVAVVPYKNSGNYAGEICVAGMPHILSTYPDGSMDVYITGEVKCKLTSFDEENPYKIYYYRSVEESLYNPEDYEIELSSLKIMLEKWAQHFLTDPGQRDSFASTLEDPELLVNYCAVFLIDDLALKRSVMLAENLGEKIQVLLHVIGPKEIPLGPFMPSLKF